ncbi:MAG: phosphotransferase enzyme family protein [Candidatus Thorarchaeota archaeon]|jgi:Ser/Thr protein kinase RdoA (MazF antagonist)
MTDDWLETALKETSALYGFQVNKLVKIGGGYENKMFGYEAPEAKFVVRVTPPDHKTPSEVRAEMDWLVYLQENDAPVEHVITSKNNNLVEVTDTDAGPISVVCFEWAPGKIVMKDDFSPELFHSWGKAVGMMHRLTKDYESPTKQPNRIQWYDDEYLNRDLIPQDQEIVLERFDSLMDHFKNQPSTRDSFGLIHQDVHNDNLFLDGNHLTVLDFDDCVYGFFIFDIANALGFSIWEKSDEMNNRQFADFYLKHFMEGYQEENHLVESIMEEDLPKALKLFEFIHYNAFNMDYDLAGSGSFDDLEDNTKQILKRYRKSIEDRLPYIENTFNPYR